MKLKIVKDNNPIMRKKSLSVDLPLSSNDKEILDDGYVCQICELFTLVNNVVKH